MNIESFFDAQRFCKHLKKLVRREIMLICIGGFVVFCLSLASGFSRDWRVVSGLIFISGIVYASFAFRELNHSPASALNFLMLPVSSFEKCLSRWIISGFVYPAVLFAAIAFAFFLRESYASAVNCMFASSGAKDLLLPGMSFHKEVVSAPTFFDLIECAWQYSVVHAIFFWGSAVFRKAAFLKTAIAFLCGYVAIKIIALACILATLLLLDCIYGDLNTVDFWRVVAQARTVLQMLWPCCAALILCISLIMAFKKIKSVEV